MITALVPLKTKSERLEGKNLRFFVDCSLYEHKLKQLKDTHFDRIVVSSESKEVIKIAQQYGFQGHLRNPKYATPDIPMREVYEYICSEIPGDDVAWVNVNNPLATAKIYNTAIQLWKYNKHNHDCLLSVYDLQKFVFYKEKPLNWTPSRHPRTQDLKGLMALSFVVNIRNRKEVIKNKCFVGEKPFFYFIDPITSLKIDYEEDLELCRMLWKKRKK